MPPLRKHRDQRLRDSLRKKRAAIIPGRFPPELHSMMRARLASAVRALHRFRPCVVEWGQGRKGGAIQLVFRPLAGYKSISRVEEELTKLVSRYHKYPADFIHGFKEWVGLAVRFMAYPSKEERQRFKELSRLDRAEWPYDFVTAEAKSIGNIGGTITFVGNEQKPSFFIQSIKIRDQYFRLPKELRRRYASWQKRWVEHIEEQCRALGFGRVAWIPSTDRHFLSPDMRIHTETKEALYKKLPERMHYTMETLAVPTENGMREVQYYAKKLR